MSFSYYCILGGDSEGGSPGGSRRGALPRVTQLLVAGARARRRVVFIPDDRRRAGVHSRWVQRVALALGGGGAVGVVRGKGAAVHILEVVEELVSLYDGAVAVALRSFEGLQGVQGQLQGKGGAVTLAFRVHGNTATM